MEQQCPVKPLRTEPQMFSDGVHMARQYLSESMDLLEQTKLITEQLGNLSLIPSIRERQLTRELSREIKRISTLYKVIAVSSDP